MAISIERIADDSHERDVRRSQFGMLCVTTIANEDSRDRAQLRRRCGVCYYKDWK